MKSLFERLCVCGLLAFVVTALFLASSAHAGFDLQITEMWMGNDPGSNLSEDWFEITNFGDTSWTTADGNLYMDDDSADTGDAAIMTGITSIAPGETVVFVDESTSSDWSTLWTPEVTLPQVGDYDGKGLGQGGDGVSLFIDNGGLSLIDYELYPDASANGGQSWDVTLGAFSTVGNASGAVATIELNDENQPAIGSPGSTASIPEPTSLVLVLSCGLGLLFIRKR